MDRKETKEPPVSQDLRVLQEWREGRVCLAPAVNPERRVKLVYLDSRALAVVTAYPASEAYPDPQDHKVTQERTELRVTSDPQAQRATREEKATWDLSAVLVQGASAEKSDPLDPRERKGHLA